MFAVREEVEVLKEQIAELIERNNQLEYENGILRAAASAETLAKLAQPRQQPPPSSSSWDYDYVSSFRLLWLILLSVAKCNTFLSKGEQLCHHQTWVVLPNEAKGPVGKSYCSWERNVAGTW